MAGSSFWRRGGQQEPPERAPDHVEVSGGVGAGADVAGNAIGEGSSVTNNFFYGPKEAESGPGGQAPPRTAAAGPDERRYQVFVSSTSLDLREEREAVIDELVKEGYIPSGMELFGAASAGTWEVIERVIDDCDYVVLILAGRYGEVREGGVSFTEREYDHARSMGKPVLVFAHGDPDGLPKRLVEQSEEGARRMAAFREKVRTGSPWSVWHTTGDLVRSVARSLRQEVGRNPQPGWVRGNSTAHTVLAEWKNLVEPGAQLGITRMSVNGQAGEAMSENLAKAESIGIMSTSGTRLIEIQTPYLIRSLASGGRIRVLVPRPDGQFLTDVDESESQWGDQRSPIAAEVREVEARLRAIVRETQTRSRTVGSIELGFFTTHLRSTMILCDRTWGWLTLTLPPAKAPETPSLELRGTADFGLIDACWKHFDRTWAIVEQRGDVKTIS